MGRGSWNCTCPKTTWATCSRPSRRNTTNRARSSANCCAKQLRGKLHDASDEQLGEAVEKALAEIPDEQLHNKVQEFYLAGFHGQIEKIATEVTDETLRGAAHHRCCTRPMTMRPRSSSINSVGGLKTEIDAAKAQEAKQAEDARKAEEEQYVTLNEMLTT